MMTNHKRSHARCVLTALFLSIFFSVPLLHSTPESPPRTHTATDPSVGETASRYLRYLVREHGYSETASTQQLLERVQNRMSLAAEHPLTEALVAAVPTFSEELIFAIAFVKAVYNREKAIDLSGENPCTVSLGRTLIFLRQQQAILALAQLQLA